MNHIPGHHVGPIWERLKAQGPLVTPGMGYQEIIARPCEHSKGYLTQVAALAQRNQKCLMAAREAEIAAGLVHQTPAMEEALAKLEMVCEREA